VLPYSVLIVNYNGEAHLPRCLSALERQTTPRHRFEVVVVDNASADRSVELVRRSHPWVRLVVSETNVGFAEGNNIAARHAHGRKYVLLNNDTVPDPYWLEELAAVESDLVASKLVFDSDPNVINSGGLFLTRDGRGADLGFRQPDDGRHENPQATFAGCGAAVSIPRNGDIFPSDYFMYFEDLSACWRHQLGNRTISTAPRSLVRHVHGAAAGDQSPLFRYYVERNRAITNIVFSDTFLVCYSVAVLLGKVGIACIRSLSPSRQPGGRGTAAVAVTRSLISFMIRLPKLTVERYRWRVEEQLRCGS
jgi:GT2 family glycosyltransferase